MRLIAAFLISSLAFAARVDAAPNLPTINVWVSIEDTDVLANFAQADKNKKLPAGTTLRPVTNAVARRFAAHLHEAISFINWVPVDEQNLAGAIGGLQLVAVPVGGATYLEMRVANKAVPNSRIAFWDEDDLVRANDDPVKLQSELTAAIDKDFVTQKASDDTRDMILNAVPIAHGLTKFTRAQHTYFVIHVPWDQLEPAPGMIFKVSFEVPEGKLSDIGTLFLSSSSKYQDKDVVVAAPIHECENHHLTFMPVSVPKSNAKCEPRDVAEIPQLTPYLDLKLPSNHNETVLDHALVQIAKYERNSVLP